MPFSTDYFMIAILVIFLLLAAYYDLRYGIIPKKLILPLALSGVVLNSLAQGLEGLFYSIAGLFLGLGILIIPFILGGIGGGDVKLLGAVGAVLGPTMVLQAALVGALVGGFLSILTIKGIICWMPPNRETEQQVTLETSKYLGRVPYGVAIVAGTFTVLFLLKGV